ncbi:hypothetical protein [Pedobacter nototheniae]|uniref:hypothetical protein n=1 Tax=Pedobacter nototheniae TaxID=2488994 RepID=UPI001040B55B|nr:hypothetical protein [Pedobacter nototheniae]
MQTLFQVINALPREQWDYYFGIDEYNQINNPFSQASPNHSGFIESYFKRGGKVNLFEKSGIDVNDLRLPNHINSVFFLGILFFYQTNIHTKYDRGTNHLGYQNFPFIWFLIALFHDNAYAMEAKDKLTNINTLEDLKAHFDIEYDLFAKKIGSKCGHLLQSRKNYFNYRKKHFKVIDHGLLGGMLLYDKLIKVRRAKKKENEHTLFWGRRLEHHYKQAADAISLHNIYIAQKRYEALYEKYELQELISCPEVKLSDFPLFYLLGIIDTLDPLKTFNYSEYSDAYILDSLLIQFEPWSVQISLKPGSDLDFQKLIKQTTNFPGWLEVRIELAPNSLKIAFNGK